MQSSFLTKIRTHTENCLDFFHSSVSKTNTQKRELFRLISFRVSRKIHTKNGFKLSRLIRARAMKT